MRPVAELPGKQLWGREGGTFLCSIWNQLFPVMRLGNPGLLSTWNQVSCLNAIAPCWVMSERVSHLRGHIPYEIGSQVTQRRPSSAKCTSAMPLFLNCWQVLPHFAVWRPIRGPCGLGPAVGNWPATRVCCPLPSPRQVVLLQCVLPSSQWAWWWAPRSHCPVRLWKTQGHGRDKVRISGPHEHQSGEVSWQQPL